MLGMSVYRCKYKSMHILFGFYRFVNDFYPRLELLFIADPLFLYDFIYLCPEGDFQSLFRKIPAYLSLTWLSATPFSVDYINVSILHVCV